MFATGPSPLVFFIEHFLYFLLGLYLLTKTGVFLETIKAPENKILSILIKFNGALVVFYVILALLNKFF